MAPGRNSSCGQEGGRPEFCCEGVSCSGAVRITSSLTPDDRRGDVLCRLSNGFRRRYRAAPGLYACGNPGDGSPVLVTANYRFSLNCVRRAVEGRDVWILVLDTKGINVWCAAGKGTFGTAELIKRISETDLSAVVRHRTIVLPQLGAPGVAAHEVVKSTGFRVIYGPVRAEDIGPFLDAGGRATSAMRRVSFTLKERMVLTPMEFFPSLKKFIWVVLGCFIYMGIEPDGIHLMKALTASWTVIAAGLLAVLSGAVVTPLILPFIPFRSFAVKGAVAGAVLLSLPFLFKAYYFRNSSMLAAGMAFFFIAVSSYLALNFTGCTPFTNMSGVKKEIRSAVPAYIGACIISTALLIIYKAQEWGII